MPAAATPGLTRAMPRARAFFSALLPRHPRRLLRFPPTRATVGQVIEMNGCKGKVSPHQQPRCSDSCGTERFPPAGNREPEALQEALFCQSPRVDRLSRELFGVGVRCVPLREDRIEALSLPQGRDGP